MLDPGGAVGAVTPRALDYLLGATLDPADLPDRWERISPAQRRLFRVKAIGVPRRPEPRAASATGEDQFRHPTESLLVGLSAYGIPIAYEVVGSASGVEFRLGTWVDASSDPAALDDQTEVVKTLVRGLYPYVELEDEDPAEPGPLLTLAGVVIGQPAPTRRDETDAGVSWDRVIRAMRGATWRVVILAQPVADAVTSGLRDHVIEEMRATSLNEGPKGMMSPLASYYTTLLEGMLRDLTDARSAGGWRTAVYLLGDDASYYRLASTWRAIFGGDTTVTLPTRIMDTEAALELAADWAMPFLQAPEGPGAFTHPFTSQSLLTSARLSAGLHLPRLETSGFRVRLVPPLASERGSAKPARPISLGGILENRNTGTRTYEIDADELTKHVLIAGLTGTGKTNTLFHVLGAAAAIGVPFLVIEPAKAEYRALLSTPLGADLRVYTLGREQVSPFRVNPFELLPGVSPVEHLDLLRAVFAAAFGMWAPLPQVLERCLTEIYTDRGWDLSTGTNHRQQRVDRVPPPRLRDLVAKVVEVMPQLDYSENSTKEIRAALVTRLDSLRTGAKGRMLDVERSIPMAALLAHPTVLELEGLGDDDDKAFLMGLLLIRLWEHRRHEQSPDSEDGRPIPLRHLLVIEEAHRLLSASTKQSTEREGDPRGKLVEAFSQMLSEIRSYGQGIVIADQVPVRLAPDVIKNTNLKIAHQLVSPDDRSAMAGAMGMDETQSQILGTLIRGEAAVFSQGDDTASLVVVPSVKDKARRISDDEIGAASAQWRERDGLVDLELTRPSCAHTCGTVMVCAQADRIAGDPRVGQVVERTIDTLLASSEALGRLWPDLETVILAVAPAWLNRRAVLAAVLAHASHNVAHRRGAQAGWSYDEAGAFAEGLTETFLARATASPWHDALDRVQRLYVGLARRASDPFPACADICPGQPAQCRYRYAVLDSIDRGARRATWLSLTTDADRFNYAGYIADDVVDWAAQMASPGDQAALRDAHDAARSCTVQQLLFSRAEGRSGRLLEQLQAVRTAGRP